MFTNTREINKSSDNGISWDVGHMPYAQLHSVVKETVAGCAHF